MDIYGSCRGWSRTSELPLLGICILLICLLVEALTNQEEVELRSKIEALGLEVTKVPSKSSQHLDELEIAKELDKLSAKLDDVDEMISSAMASDPQVKSLLSGTADVWMPVITASAEE
ncbi:PREDICTED: uncharacterized protein LOC101307530 isoform 2 [Fragaria vesca subsp. vesca]